jgi:hypothetical protein
MNKMLNPLSHATLGQNRCHFIIALGLAKSAAVGTFQNELSICTMKLRQFGIMTDLLP